MKQKAVFLLLSLSLLSGCARYYIVNIDSINNREEVTEKTYILIPGNKDTSASDLQFREYAHFASAALAKNGYKLADSAKDASVEIYLSYGIGEPEKHVYSYAEPLWGQVRTNAYTYSQEITAADGVSKTYYSTTRIDPEYGVTGFTTRTGTYTSYKKFIVLDAYSTKKRDNNRLENIWRTSISSTGTTKDLRKIFPVLLAAAVKYIGSNTGEEIVIEFPEESEAVAEIRK
ncbi:MAG TPA: hypothetical protein P5511_05330 [Candidatus Goldiibacteriota bacterium]|nr:hypothetical protein [Candidatus Goldiibacteriota bacterium]